MAALARNPDVSWSLLNTGIFIAILPTLILLVALVWRYVHRRSRPRRGEGLRRTGRWTPTRGSACRAGAVQHAPPGPYSPVLEVDARRLVVLSGQVAVDLDGKIVGATIEEQAAATLANCRRQLASAGCDFADVFKVNVYLADLAEWARFNAIYETILPAPLPVRTAVQAVLLSDFRVEIEMWAVKP